MSQEEVYRALARRLDEIPNGFPPTESGAELRLLERLFTPEEAALAVHLRLTPEPAGEIARRSGTDPAATAALLKGMARRGLIRAARGEGELHFGLLPFVVGFYEEQGSRLDAELAGLVEAYLREAIPAVVGTAPALQRVIPVEQALPVDVEVLPYESASALLDQAAAWGVTDCICRKQKGLLGQACDRPLDVCMALSKTPGVFDSLPTVRALTREEAGETLRRAAAAGLVPSTRNTQGGVWYICNCCPCCCGVLRGVTEFGIAGSVAHSAFWAAVDQALCTGCQACLERCSFGALGVEDGVAAVDRERCLGCGLCTTECPSGALRLERRPAEETLAVPPDMDAWWQARAQSRGLDLGAIL